MILKYWPYELSPSAKFEIYTELQAISDKLPVTDQQREQAATVRALDCFFLDWLKGNRCDLVDIESLSTARQEILSNALALFNSLVAERFGDVPDYISIIWDTHDPKLVDILKEHFGNLAGILKRCPRTSESHLQAIADFTVNHQDFLT